MQLTVSTAAAKANEKVFAFSRKALEVIEILKI